MKTTFRMKIKNIFTWLLKTVYSAIVSTWLKLDYSSVVPLIIPQKNVKSQLP